MQWYIAEWPEGRAKSGVSCSVVASLGRGRKEVRSRQPRRSGNAAGTTGLGTPGIQWRVTARPGPVAAGVPERYAA
jgi:hypothetical protein